MLYIVVYDLKSSKYHNKVLNTLRKYLIHIQLSVFEGTLTKSAFEQLKSELSKYIEDGDSIIFYEVTSIKYLNKIVMGKVVNYNNII